MNNRNWVHSANRVFEQEIAQFESWVVEKGKGFVRVDWCAAFLADGDMLFGVREKTESWRQAAAREY